MVLDIGLDLLLIDLTDGRAQIAPRPQVLTPIAFFEMREFVLQLARRSAFQVWHKLGWAVGRWTGHEQVDMVSADVPLKDGQIAAHADLPDQLTGTFCHFAFQELRPLCRHPHQVVFDGVDCVTPFAILWHLALPFGGPSYLAKAIRLKAKALNLAIGKETKLW